MRSRMGPSYLNEPLSWCAGRWPRGTERVDIDLILAERPNGEIKRRTDVVGIFHNEAAMILRRDFRPMAKKGKWRGMTIGRISLGSGLILWSTLTMTPVAAVAQPAAEVAAVRAAIKSGLAQPGTSIKPGDVNVTDLRFEGAFATATVAVAKRDSPTVFLKKSGGRWKLIFSGSGMAPGDCKDMRFPANSKMCRD